MAFPSKTDRAQILAAAMEQLEREGMQRLSLRSLAASLGLATNALYRYFEDRSHLEAALVAQITLKMRETLVKAAGRKQPEAAVRAMARAYLKFAHERRFLYEAWIKPCTHTQESQIAHESLWGFVAGLVAQIAGETRAPEAATALWAFLHGFVELEAAGVFQQGKPLSSFEWGLTAWLDAAQT
ncbi:AcrR family transcriptional regulator [Granulicella aggregans]|uniref:AcrR family transcriptional regulator n=1 Tax=Granulicella aggregans TaxID=474949 RepID=A0A7W7ZD99_9BACT|nr:TetR/AcrR family transcriptional regulator [Granulicella aggregans]MBB5057790.1 AcrR family transcriptional regulator [Granulicella aggregans]